ncbi:MAG: type VI secretion system baseplate subunit TssG [Chitinophagaceae bacterium]|nr:type VI secretion system baseplate subunit TssG [Chitinophagaceae bacterium]
MPDMLELMAELKRIRTDLRAEVIMAALQEEGFAENQLEVHATGTFNRSFRKDVVKYKLKNDNAFQETLQVELSRDGMYDLLPEGLFHQSLKGSNTQVSKMVAEHKRFKQEEADARAFFAVFENEFFHQKTVLEKKEKTFLRNITLEKNNLLNRLWKLPNHFPQQAGKKMLEYMPKTGSICGRREAMALALSDILHEQVSVDVNVLETPLIQDQQASETQLGLNSMLGNSYNELLTQYCFNIGPLQHHSIESFRTDEPMALVLHTFMSYFVPLEAEIKITFIPNKNLTSAKESDILGYNFEL